MITPNRTNKPRHPWRKTLHEVIFEADTPAGKWFDVILIFSILCSVAVVMLESIASVRHAHGELLRGLEWIFTVLFSIEYLLRIVCVGKPVRYMKSFFGLADLAAILPTYLSQVVPGSQFMIVIRLLRVLRIFRVLKLVQYLAEASILIQALRASRRKITVFLFTVLTLVVILGSLIYIIEDESAGFTSIPRSIYWAIVTLTTVGYGDISPQTASGQALAALIMILGFSIIAVPTGIMSLEIARAADRPISTQACPECSAEGHDTDATHCKYCGAKL
jgi:voltage-gated potassium channel